MPHTVAAGQLRHLITLQTPTRTPSTVSGEMQLTWTDTRPVWASVTPKTPKDQEQFGTQKARITHEVIVRFCTDITGDCRFNYGGRILNIVGAPLDLEERHFALKIQCSEEA